MKAVIQVGGKQHIVAEQQSLLVDRLAGGTKELSLQPLMVFDDKVVRVGKPALADVAVKAKVDDPIVKGEKLRVVRFEAKKRVRKINGYRPQHSRITITKIT